MAAAIIQLVGIQDQFRNNKYSKIRVWSRAYWKKGKFAGAHEKKQKEKKE